MTFFTDEQIEYMSQRTVRVDYLTEFQFISKTVRVWNGEYPLSSGGYTWTPMHGIGTIDGLGQSGDAQSEQVTFSISGLPGQSTDILALALSESVDANQQLVNVYIQFFDEDWQPIGNPNLMWFGFMQPPRVSQNDTDIETGKTQEISLVAENAFFNRSRPPYGRYTDRDQQKRYDGDRFFQFTAELKTKTVVYPDY